MSNKEIKDRKQHPMTTNLTKKFLEIYRKNPCLWDTKCKDYTNRNLKKLGYEEMINLLKPHIPNVDKEYIVKKVNTLRSAFRKEYRKLCDSSPNNSYKPKLWYFDLLLFTVESKPNKKKTENTAIVDEKSEVVEEEFVYGISNYTDDYNETVEDNKDDFEKNIHENNLSEIDNTVATTTLSTSAKRKRKGSSHQEKPTITKLSSFINEYSISEKYQDEFDHFGCLVASKLRKISKKDENQQVICENLISQALMKALLCKLTENSFIKC